MLEAHYYHKWPFIIAVKELCFIQKCFYVKKKFALRVSSYTLNTQYNPVAYSFINEVLFFIIKFIKNPLFVTSHLIIQKYKFHHKSQIEIFYFIQTQDHHLVFPFKRHMNKLKSIIILSSYQIITLCSNLTGFHQFRYLWLIII